MIKAAFRHASRRTERINAHTGIALGKNNVSGGLDQALSGIAWSSHNTLLSILYYFVQNTINVSVGQPQEGEEPGLSSSPLKGVQGSPCRGLGCPQFPFL